MYVYLYAHFLHTITVLGGVIMVVQKITRLTIYTKPELIALTETIAKETNTSRSKVVSKCLEELAQKRKRQLMEEGYKVMAKENSDFAKLAFELQSEVALR